MRPDFTSWLQFLTPQIPFVGNPTRTFVTSFKVYVPTVFWLQYKKIIN